LVVCGLDEDAVRCFAVVAAAMLPLSSAACGPGCWIVNQGIGFSALHYPHEADTILWGVAIGATALAATLIAAAVLRLVSRASVAVVLGLALLATYAVYQLVLYTFSRWRGRLHRGNRGPDWRTEPFG
jgi:hypothetical protein